MRKILFILMMLPAIVGAQDLAKSEVDKYTKREMRETTWENLAVPFNSVVRQRMKSVDGKLYLELSITLHSAFRVDEGDLLYVLLDNGNTIKIPCARGGIADYRYNKYGSSWNEYYLYDITLEDCEQIKNNLVTGIRVNMGSEYKTFDNVKEKNALKLRKAVELVTSAK